MKKKKHENFNFYNVFNDILTVSKSSSDHHQAQQCKCSQVDPVQSGLQSADSEWSAAAARIFCGELQEDEEEED